MMYDVYVLQSDCVTYLRDVLPSTSFDNVPIKVLEVPVSHFRQLLDVQMRHQAECYVLFRRRDSLYPFEHAEQK